MKNSKSILASTLIAGALAFTSFNAGASTLANQSSNDGACGAKKSTEQKCAADQKCAAKKDSTKNDQKCAAKKGKDQKCAAKKGKDQKCAAKKSKEQKCAAKK